MPQVENNKKLKNCPFCGSKAILQFDYTTMTKIALDGLSLKDYIAKLYWIGCENEDCIFMTRGMTDKDKLVQKYNARFLSNNIL